MLSDHAMLDLSDEIASAVDEGDENTIREALQKLSLANAAKVLDLPDENGETVLHDAVKSGQANIVKVLLEFGANPNAVGFFRETPLHRAAANNQAECVKLLLAHGAKTDIARGDAAKPIHVAAMQGAVSAMDALLVHDKSQLNLISKEGRTPFYCAAMQGQVKSLAILLAHGDNINQQNLYDMKKSALHLAAINDDIKLATFLIENQALMNQTDSGQFTPLQRCAMQDEISLSTATILINNGADVNAGDPPPLILLAQHVDQESEKCVQFANLLISHGCDVQAEYLGQTALQILKEKKGELEDNELGLYELLSQQQKKENVLSAKK